MDEAVADAGGELYEASVTVRPVRILVVDDQFVGRTVLERLLHRLEWAVRVESFPEPVAALDALARVQPDLIVTDYRMPALDGGEFIRAARLISGCAEVPVVVVSVMDDAAPREAVLAAGASAFVTRPFDHARFLALLRSLLAPRLEAQAVLPPRPAAPAAPLPERRRTPALAQLRERGPTRLDELARLCALALARASAASPQACEIRIAPGAPSGVCLSRRDLGYALYHLLVTCEGVPRRLEVSWRPRGPDRGCLQWRLLADRAGPDAGRIWRRRDDPRPDISGAERLLARLGGLHRRVVTPTALRVLVRIPAQAQPPEAVYSHA